MVYPVGVTENCLKFLYVIVNNFSKYALNFTKFYGDTVQYQYYSCTKFETNRNMGRQFFRILKIFLFWCEEEEEEEEEEEYEENWAIFKNEYLVNCQRNQRKNWYAR